MGGKPPYLDILETGRTDAGGDLRQREAEQGGDPRQRPHRHQHHPPGSCHQRHPEDHQGKGTPGGERRGGDFLRRLRAVYHRERG